MQIRFIRRSLIAKLAACGLLALSLVQSNARASQPSIMSATEGRPTVYTVTFQGTLGLARGQTLRITGSNGNEPGSRGGREPMRALATLYDAHGNPIAESAEAEIPAGEFRSIDFDRDDLDLAGEPGAGRIQVRAQIRYRFLSIVDRTQLSPPSLELIENTTGRTTVGFTAAIGANEQ